MKVRESQCLILKAQHGLECSKLGTPLTAVDTEPTLSKHSRQSSLRAPSQQYPLHSGRFESGLHHCLVTGQQSQGLCLNRRAGRRGPQTQNSLSTGKSHLPHTRPIAAPAHLGARVVQRIGQEGQLLALNYTSTTRLKK
jgi:hypothetical protein